ncbi:hypothetical protein D3C73_1219620 [compost metagenome]
MRQRQVIIEDANIGAFSGTKLAAGNSQRACNVCRHHGHGLCDRNARINQAREQCKVTAYRRGRESFNHTLSIKARHAAIAI